MTPRILGAARLAPVLLASSALVAGTLGLSTPAQAAPGSTTISGVIDRTGGFVVQHVTVELDSPTAGLIARTTTDDQGKYSFKDVDATLDAENTSNDFTLDVNGYDASPYYLEAQTEAFAVERDADATKNVTLENAPTYSVAGKVTDVGGAVALGNVKVLFTIEDTGEQFFTFTKPDGTYSADGLPDGAYDITANGDHGASGYKVAYDYFNIDGDDVTGENIELEDATNAVGTVTGTITNESSQKVANLPVEVVNGKGFVEADAKTDEQGVYTIDDVVPGTYTVRVNDSNDYAANDQTYATKSFDEVVVKANRQVTRNFEVLTAITCATNPVVTGTAQVGQTLTATGATFANKGDSSLVVTQGWGSGRGETGGAIEGATGQTYTIQPGDAGSTINFVVFGTTPDRGVAVCGSNLVSVPPTTAPGTPVPGAVTPAVTGKVKKGKAVSAGVTVPAGATASYQWYRTFKKGKKTVTQPIPGATASTYKPKGKDVGDKIFVVVSYSAPGYAATTLTSEPKKVK